MPRAIISETCVQQELDRGRKCIEPGSNLDYVCSKALREIRGRLDSLASNVFIDLRGVREQAWAESAAVNQVLNIPLGAKGPSKRSVDNRLLDLVCALRKSREQLADITRELGIEEPPPYQSDRKRLRPHVLEMMADVQ
jgi:hypothetical protein